MPVAIEIEGLDELQAKFAQSPEIVGEELSHATKQAGAGIIKEEVVQAPHDSGRLQQSIKMEFEPIQVTVWPDVEYAKYVVSGTKPHTPPVGALEAWARRHGVNPYAVQRAIKMHGTKPNNFVQRTRGGIAGFVQDLFKIARKNIIERL
jgi:hypothetical protein